MTFSYALERLFVDQDHDWVVDTIPAVLAWVPGKSRNKAQPPFRFDVEHTVGRVTKTVAIDLIWDLPALTNIVPGLVDHARRLRAARSAQREHVTELAAYGLSFVAISALMPGRRVKSMRKGLPPDILFDLTPNALCGVETAGRSVGGRRALAEIRDGAPTRGQGKGSSGKAALLRARTDIAEVHLSLWCASPRISIFEQVKP
jgi:hypothetical protein